MEKKLQFSPGRIILLSYLFVIAVGTFLLSLPQSQLVRIPFIDLLFTSASCTCVTGHTTVPVSYFTTFGKTVMLSLIQLGGIGLLTLSLFFISLFINLGMTTKIIAGELFEFKWSQIKTFIVTIVATTFCFELIGTIFFYFSFQRFLPPQKAFFYALFHSIASFCNTGIFLLEEGFTPFQNDVPFLLTTALLVFVGGIGFVVWLEVARKVKARCKTSFSLHTKIVLSASAIIILLGTTTTWLLERGNTLKELSFFDGFFLSFINTITLRSAGFEIFSTNQLMPATILIFLLLMYIGGSPGSIAGGIKTSTLALFVATMAAIVKNRKDVELFGRRIPQDQVYKAMSIIVLSATWIISITFILLITEAGFNFTQIFFEVMSAFSLCGLHAKITATFSIFGKSLIIFTMLIGRIGSLTLLMALWKRKKKYMYQYPEEQIVVG